MAIERERTRRLAWEGVLNARDLGGYPTAGGRETCWGAVVRSGSLTGLTPAGCEALISYQVRAVVDLRLPDEVADQPHPFAEPADHGIAYANVSFLGPAARGLHHAGRRVQADARPLPQGGGRGDGGDRGRAPGRRAGALRRGQGPDRAHRRAPARLGRCGAGDDRRRLRPDRRVPATTGPGVAGERPGRPRGARGAAAQVRADGRSDAGGARPPGRAVWRGRGLPAPGGRGRRRSHAHTGPAAPPERPLSSASGGTATRATRWAAPSSATVVN